MSISTTASSTEPRPTTASCSPEAGVAKDAAQAAANLGVGDWVDVRLIGADGLIGARAGQTAGFYVKLIDLAGSAGSVSSFKLYFTSVSRAIASCACDPNFESTLGRYVPDQHRGRLRSARSGHHRRGHICRAGPQVGGLPLGGAQVHPRQSSSPTPTCSSWATRSPTSSRTSSWRSYTPTDMDGNPNPYYDDLTNDNIPDGRVDIREGYIRSAYHEADQTLALGRSLMGTQCDRLCFLGPRLRAAVVCSQCWQGPGRCWYPDPGADQQLPCRGRARRGQQCQGMLGRWYSSDLRQHCPAGGRRHMRRCRTAIVSAFKNLTDPANPGAQVVERVMLKEELRNVDGSRLAASEPQR